jgi:hypothetical protein
MPRAMAGPGRPGNREMAHRTSVRAEMLAGPNQIVSDPLAIRRVSTHRSVRPYFHPRFRSVRLKSRSRMSDWSGVWKGQRRARNLVMITATARLGDQRAAADQGCGHSGLHKHGESSSFINVVGEEPHEGPGFRQTSIKPRICARVLTSSAASGSSIASISSSIVSASPPRCSACCAICMRSAA